MWNLKYWTNLLQENDFMTFCFILEILCWYKIDIKRLYSQRKLFKFKKYKYQSRCMWNSKYWTISLQENVFMAFWFILEILHLFMWPHKSFCWFVQFMWNLLYLFIDYINGNSGNITPSIFYVTFLILH